MTNFEAARWLHPVGGDDAQRPRLDVLLAPAEHARQVVDDVRSGLGRARAQLPLEDLADSRTQALWAQVAGTEHFHPLRATRSLVATNAAAIAERAGARSLVVIGDADAQVVADLATACATTGLTEVVSVGPVGPRLAAACTSIAELLPGRTVRGVVADPTRQLPLVPFTRPGLLYVQGTTLARLDGTTRSRLLAGTARAMTGDDHLLVGFDLTTDRSQALSAFDDAEGLHAERARNALGVLARELAAEVDPAGWEPTIGWDERHRAIELGLRARTSQRIAIGPLGLDRSFDAGEVIELERNATFRPSGISVVLGLAELDVRGWWGQDHDYALVLASPSLRCR